MTAITRHHHADNNTTSKRLRFPAAPDLSRPIFEHIGNGNYRPIIEGATCQFIVKAYTPDQCWRVFYKGADDLTSTELERRFPFSTPAQAMWLEMATAAYDQRLDDDRADDDNEFGGEAYGLHRSEF
jgi:hypothetical protein